MRPSKLSDNRPSISVKTTNTGSETPLLKKKPAILQKPSMRDFDFGERNEIFEYTKRQKHDSEESYSKGSSSRSLFETQQLAKK